MKMAKEKLDITIQKDIFFDFKKMIISGLIIGILFFFLALALLLVPDTIKNFFIVLILLLAVFVVIFGLSVLSKIKRREIQYKQNAKKLFDNLKEK